jgi:GNAT superfamily N-acetyltransferase
VYHALTSGDKHLNIGQSKVVYFDEAVSPFAGFEQGYAKGFDDLHDQLPAGRQILYATPEDINTPPGWELLVKISGVQMVLSDPLPAPALRSPTTALPTLPVSLSHHHVPQMIELTALTRPGPFGPRTIEFGHYHGIFEGHKLVAMTGQRMHVHGFTEASAVCTHPDHLGKGYASALLQHQIELIHQQGQIPFLHVRDDNKRAIELYLRLGFYVSGVMNFYFMKKSRCLIHDE